MNKSPKQLLSHPEVKLELLVLQSKFPVSPHIPALLVEFAELENDRDGSLISVCFFIFYPNFLATPNKKTTKKKRFYNSKINLMYILGYCDFNLFYLLLF